MRYLPQASLTVNRDVGEERFHMLQILQGGKPVSAVRAGVLGALLLTVAFVVAEFVTFPAAGHRINTDSWPAEARAILDESPREPLSAARWRRLEKVLQPYGGALYGQVPYWSQTVRASWWWFVVLPFAAIMLLVVRRFRVTVSTVALVAGPSLVVLLVGLRAGGGAI